MKVGTIFTGGTIGSQIDQSGYIVTGQAAPFVLLELYKKQVEHETEFVIKEPYRILSENLRAANLEMLIQCVEECLQNEELDGLIVTHGTDTLQYTASILGYVFGGSEIPIVLVSSNYVLTDSRANGLTNFRYAVEFIKQCKRNVIGKKAAGKGVFVSYCNQGGDPTIHRATRLQPPVPFSDDVSSVGYSWYGRFEGGSYVANPWYGAREGFQSIRELIEQNRENGELTGNISHQRDGWSRDSLSARLSEKASEIMRIVPYVGMIYPEIPDGTKAVLHESYHSGTICINEDLKRFAKQAEKMQVPIYLTGLSQHEKAYETVKAYEELGIHPLPESSVIAQYCKLWLAVSSQLDVRMIMNTAVAEDFLA